MGNSLWQRLLIFRRTHGRLRHLSRTGWVQLLCLLLFVAGTVLASASIDVVAAPLHPLPPLRDDLTVLEFQSNGQSPQVTQSLQPSADLLAQAARVQAQTAITLTPSFDEKRFFGPGTEFTNSVAVGDMDGDGDLDIVTGNSGQSVVYLNDSLDNFTTPRNFGTSTDNTNSVAVGDMDGDGDLDIVTGKLDGQSAVYLNDGLGNFTTSVRNFGASTDRTESVAVGDIDGDGDLDIVTGMDAHQQDVVYLNDGQGNFDTPRPFGTDIDRTLSVAVGDMDGDGDLDIVRGRGPLVSSPGGPNEVYLNDGLGNFATVHTFGISVERTYSVAVGDMDSDGDLDIVAGKGLEQSAVYLNDGLGNFDLDTPRDFGTNADRINSVALGDMDSDGDLDIVVGKGGQQNVVYLNDGLGNFDTPCNFGTGADNTTSVAVGDMDSDGHLDIVTGNNDQQSVVYLNQGSGNYTKGAYFGVETDVNNSVAVGDMDGDSDLDVIVGNGSGQSAAYLNDGLGNFTTSGRNFGTSMDNIASVAVGDMDGDGDLDIVAATHELNIGEPNVVYLNDGLGNFTTTRNFGTDTEKTNSVAVGDMDGDGDLDIVTGNGDSAANTGQQNVVYLNDSLGNFTTTHNFGTSTDYTSSVAVGDMDGDGDLDIVTGHGDYDIAQQNVVYLNDGLGNFTIPRNFGASTDRTFSVAVGDMDGDGDLDIVTGNFQQQNVVYLNDGLGNFATLRYFGTGDDKTYSVAVGDMDGDGDLDIVTGNFQQQSAVYLNNGLGNFTSPRNFGADADWVGSVAVGDMDGDGDLDIVNGNDYGNTVVYFNGLSSSVQIANRFPMTGLIRPNPLFNANFEYTNPLARTPIIPMTYTLSDPEGDPIRSIRAYYSPDGGGKWYTATATSDTITTNLNAMPTYIVGTTSLNWLDITSTGTPVALGDDTLAGPFNLGFSLSSFERPATKFWISSNGWLALSSPFGSTYQNVCLPSASAPANLVAPFWDDLNPGVGGQVYYRQVDADTMVVEFYQVPRFSGVGNYTFEVVLKRDGTVTFQYLTMTGTLDSATIGVQGAVRTQVVQVACNTNYVQNNLAVRLKSTRQTYVYNWDVFNSGFFGQSDNVVFRLGTYPNLRPSITGVPVFQRPYASATTFPFRVRGTQVQVLSGTQPIANALVYRLPVGQTLGAQPFADSSGRPFRTDGQGYLQGRGQLGLGDQLLAMVPVSSTESYTLFNTSAAPTLTGLNMHTVTQPGVQTLTVSPANPLVLFNLDVSLEWDARQDATTLNRLQFDLQRASELLYDWTDGQAALGHINIYQAGEHWNDANVRLLANNRLRPNASQGGIISTTLSEIINTSISSTQVITYESGQIRMAVNWNRYGDPGGPIGDDWARAFAHELGHYLFFQDDDYLGYDAAGNFVAVSNCPGAMSDPYSGDKASGYDELHVQANWASQCANTLANRETGRSDWQTLKHFYPALNETSVTTAGPSSLPLAVTQIEVRPIQSDQLAMPMVSPLYSLVRAEGGSYAPQRASTYLFQDTDQDGLNNRLIELGSPVSGKIEARGARAGDRLCVIDPETKRLGCAVLNEVNRTLALTARPDWAPSVLITPVTSRTIQVAVSGISQDVPMQAQLFPRDGDASAIITLAKVGTTNTYLGTFTLPDEALEASVHIWIDEGGVRRETLTSYSIGGNPVPRRPGSGSRRYPSRRYRRAPVLSSDGQAQVLGIQGTFPLGEFYALQTVDNFPASPSWTTVVGQAYRLVKSAGSPSLAGSTFTVNYLDSEVPFGEESSLTIYFLPNCGGSGAGQPPAPGPYRLFLPLIVRGGTQQTCSPAWQALPTTRDEEGDLVSAQTAGEGLYLVLSSIDIPLQQGWNNVSYPVAESRPVAIALASIAGKYTSVCSYQAADVDNPWHCYDGGTPPFGGDWVNDLTMLEFGSYWIYATQDTILSLKGPYGGAVVNQSDRSDAERPPAIFYGTIESDPTFTAQANMAVTAKVNDVICGQAKVIEVDGLLRYVIDVRVVAKDGNATCGRAGGIITLSIDGHDLSPTATWDNSHMQQLDLRPAP
jgi:hypothetical protein